MKRLAIALLLFSGCAFPDGSYLEFRPFYSTSSSTTIGINADQSRFTNEPLGDDMGVVVVLGFLLGSKAVQPISLSERFYGMRSPTTVGEIESKLKEATDALEAKRERKRLEEKIEDLDDKHAEEAEPKTPEEQDAFDKALRAKQELEKMSAGDKIWLIVFIIVGLIACFVGVKIYKLWKNGNGKKEEE